MTRLQVAVLALLAPFAFAPLCDVRAQPASSPSEATAPSILGVWKATIPGRGKGLVFKGELVVNVATGPNLYSGVLTLRYPDGKRTVVQDAKISVEGSKVTIKCSVLGLIGFSPKGSYNADEYLLTRSGNIMSGRSEDVSGYADQNNVFEKL